LVVGFGIRAKVDGSLAHLDDVAALPQQGSSPSAVAVPACFLESILPAYHPLLLPTGFLT